MTLLALVLGSASVHAWWNPLVTRHIATVNGAALTCLLGAVSGVLLAPAALIAVRALIGAYTLWDEHVVDPLGVPRLAFEWMLSASMALLVAPIALREPGAIGSAWRANRGTMLLVAVVSSLSYILFLTALSTAPVSRVAPTRERSILLGTFLGGALLREADAMRCMSSAAAMAAGVLLLALF